MLSVLRTACGALTDLAEEAAPILEAERKSSDVPVVDRPKKEEEASAGVQEPPGKVPGVVDVDARAREAGEGTEKKKRKKEDSEKKGKKKTVVKKERTKKEKDERDTEDVEENPGGPASSSGIRRDGATPPLPRDRDVEENPANFGLTTISKGSAGRHFARTEGRRRGDERPPEPRDPPPSRPRLPPPPRAPPRTTRSRSREDYRRRGTKGVKHRERGRYLRSQGYIW